MDRIAPVQQLEAAEPISQRAYQHILSAIVRLDLAPGQILSEQQVSMSLGASRQPVREAFIRLEMQGLISIVPQRYTVVNPISIRRVRGAAFVRAALESAVIGSLTNGLSGDQLTALHDLINKQESIANAGEVDSFLPLDDAFHASLVAFANRPSVWTVIQNEKVHLDRVRYLLIKGVDSPSADRMGIVIRQHRQIVDALAAGNSVAAGELMRAHIDHAIQIIERLIRENRSLFVE